MTTKTKTALLAALMVGAASLTIGNPAFAKKEVKAETGPKLSPAFQKPAYDAQQKMQAGDLAGAEAALVLAEAAAKSEDEIYLGQQLRLGLEQTKLKASTGGDSQKFAAGMVALLPSINNLIANPKTPAADKARFLQVRGNMYYDGKKFTDAANDYEAARAAGATGQELGLQLMKAKGEAGDPVGAATELQHEIDTAPAGQKVPDTWYRYVLSKLVKAKNTPLSVTWSQKLVEAYPTPENWRTAVGVYASSIAPTVKLDARQRLDLLRVLRAAHALADENDYNEYAQVTVDLGLYDEALSVIDEGNKNGKLQSANVLGKSLKASATTGNGLEKPLAAQETAAKAAKSGDLMVQVADSYLGKGQNAKAVELYRAAIAKGFDKPTAGASSRRHFLETDEVNMHLAIALALSGDKAGATTVFSGITTSPRKEVAGFWMTWLASGATA